MPKYIVAGEQYLSIKLRASLKHLRDVEAFELDENSSVDEIVAVIKSVLDSCDQLVLRDLAVEAKQDVVQFEHPVKILGCAGEVINSDLSEGIH